MGVCSSNSLSPEAKKKLEEERERNKALDSQLRKEDDREQRVHKLLLLGAGESGKSTLFKQMVTIYGKGYPVDERKNYTPIVFNNIITAMKTLCSEVHNYGNIMPENEQAYHAMLNDVKDDIIDERVGIMVKQLWNDEGIQRAYDKRSNFQLFDSAEYFFTRIDDIMARDYIPSHQDVLRSRVRTTGIVENEFSVDHNFFKMFDVGGQRNERKKWIHCFENVTAVIFVAAISEYDQVLYEDETTNRMDEALKLFEDICNSRWFRETSMLLFLNKKDIFEQKIQKVKLSDYFNEFPGPEKDATVAQNWIREQFKAKNRSPNKMIYTHITCATDTNNIRVVFDAVKNIVIRNSLRQAGLLA